MEERARPNIHFAPRENWMNDPNGLIFWEGHYHLFYQHNPYGPDHANIAWGHTKSRDLLHWQDLPVGLAPTPGSVDEDGCYSGCAVVEDGTVYLLYTGVQGDRQRPCIARAVDDGLTAFEKFKENPVIVEEPLPGLVGFRDHTVRREGGEFRQLIGGGTPELGGCVLEYRGTTLTKWEYCGVFLAGKSAQLPGAMWECPDLFCVDGRWFVVLSLLEDTPSVVIFVEGKFEGQRFVPSRHGRFDIGTRWYAPQSFLAPDGRRICFGWLRERRDELPLQSRARIGVMSLPRELVVGTDGGLGMVPIAELALLRATQLTASSQNGESDTVSLVADHPIGALEVEVATNDLDGWLVVDLLGVDGGLVLEVAMDGCSIDIDESPLPLDGHPQSLSGTTRLYYDEGICEVFAPSGAVRSEICYPQRPVLSVSARVDSGGGRSTGACLQGIRAWELAAIWDEGAGEGARS